MRPVPPSIAIPQAIQTGLEHHQAGRLPQAEEVYRQVLQADPGNPDALHLLGVIASQVGKYEHAVELIDKALTIKPGFAEALSNRGNALQELKRYGEALASYDKALSIKPEIAEVLSNRGNALKALRRYDEALTSYDKALAIRPDYAEALFNRGTALQKLTQLDAAVLSFDRAIAIKPDYAEAYSNRGNALASQGRLDEANASYRKALSFRPGYAEAHNNLGNTLKDQGKLDEAIASYRKAASLKPDFAAPHYNLGLVFQDQGKLDEAVASYREALSLKPDYVEAHSNLGNALKDLGNLDEAIASCRKALSFKPDFAEAHSNLGNALAALDRPDEAAASYRKALSFKPDFAAAHYNLGNALAALGKPGEAVASYRKALSFKPNYAEAHSNLLLALNYVPALSPAEIYAAHREFARQVSHEVSPKPHSNTPDPERRLRVAYVSGDFRVHPVAQFIEPVLNLHDHDRFEIICYYNFPVADATTRRIRQHADRWRDVFALSDAALTDLIRADAVDILVDLSGHTGHNRLSAFACKPAPVQISWLGYLNTTGLDSIDYRITDRHASPKGLLDAFHSEKLLRLPDSQWHYQPPPVAPDVAAPPHAGTGFVTFAAFSNIAKIGPPVIELWSRLLARVAGSRLFIVGRGVAAIREEYVSRFTRHGVRPEQIELQDFASFQDYLALHHKADVMLDTFPYAGGTTTCHALWMGVPVVSLAGDTAPSRGGASLLNVVGLAELVAETPEQYLEIASNLALDQPRLAALRAGMRKRMAASPLMDGKRFTRDLEHAYRSVWRDWCEKQ